MARRHRGAAAALIGGVVMALAAGPLSGGSAHAAQQEPRKPAAVADSNSSMVMVLDSSGSMADDDGSGSTRIESARQAVGTVVDSLPDGYPTGLRLYGADKGSGCDDTRLARPVEPLDRDGIKKAVDDVEPKGDTPIGLSLRKAAKDLPKVPDGAIGRRTILLISDGEDNCGAPEPCEVAEELGEQGIDLRIDAIGFQVDGTARDQLKCVAEAGHGSYYDAPDADALARQLQRAGRLSADGYRFKGERISGGTKKSDAVDISPGQYVDTLAPGETRWYTARLDAESAADFAATAVPQPGVAVSGLDRIEVKLTDTTQYNGQCDMARGYFHQSEGATPLTAAVSRVPSEKGGRNCDEAGRYLLSVQRTSDDKSDQARWPFELRYGTEEPLKEGVVPAQSETEYGAGGADAGLPTGKPKKAEGGTGFNDARKIGKGAWRDTLLPAQTRWYRVPVGWGQQLRYDVEFGNEPTLDEGASGYSFVRAETFTPSRHPVSTGSGFRTKHLYNGKPTAVSSATVPVSWTNRWENKGLAKPVRMGGDYYIAVSLGLKAAELAENAAIGVVLRVDVIGDARTGPAHNAPRVKADKEKSEQAGQAESGAAGRDEGSDGAGWSGTMMAAVAGGAGAALLAGLAVAYTVSRRRAATKTTRDGAW